MPTGAAEKAKIGERLFGAIELTWDGVKMSQVFFEKISFIFVKKYSRMHTEEIVETKLSDYEIERDKPMPSKHHAIIQGNR